MTHDEAIRELRPCLRCKRWIVAETCDGCWVDAHRCPPTLRQALADLNRAVALGEEAAQLRAKLARMVERGE